jgi:hypothetical protein
MALWLGSFLTTLAGRGSTPDEDSRIPFGLFVAAFSFAWLASLGTYSIALDGVFLTFYTGLLT